MNEDMVPVVSGWWVCMCVTVTAVDGVDHFDLSLLPALNNTMLNRHGRFNFHDSFIHVMCDVSDE